MNACSLLPQDKQEKEFIFRHSRTVFELLDEDGSNDISAEEFESFGFLFNFQGSAVRQIFREFDVSGDQVSTIFNFSQFLVLIHKTNLRQSSFRYRTVLSLLYNSLN